MLLSGKVSLKQDECYFVFTEWYLIKNKIIYLNIINIYQADKHKNINIS